MPILFDSNKSKEEKKKHGEDQSNHKDNDQQETASTDNEYDLDTLLYSPSKHKLFHSFCFKPHTKFEGQKKDEQVILVLRYHPISQLPWVITTLILAMTPMPLVLIFRQQLNFTQILGIILFWYALLFSFAFINIINYLFNVGIVTTDRILDVDLQNILYKEVNIALLNKVEDVTTTTTGFIASYFDFGYVHIQTAGTEINIEFTNIPMPTEVAKIINELSKRYSTA
ncbi:hypothetical protein A3C23_03985 [Candidatus Roizmanbacteria bacterium RIFCSPHIGHO2_02_FULL_37_13b]|uniref:DUF304 domain-containing protein n=1 Tax=Candidatus Roizmanbacteria bacterium RIFCSPLOWO2_02_FULL_36_11 TaxID=1802071 RepID=A0A1F7JGZ3_9BACT|nr:MAG: hypothetical protein A3C23_03985 [Candidatus Roizmanbacteria bacterium RIFCSPHIGHO2_02_FULL_37_13b]OGK54879.1 MAG: hypothetical protein A3H78_00135 [Candidatus Roizmanbacteria bacterium RIFCSPLOWO2_02_FULL_36_11]